MSVGLFQRFDLLQVFSDGDVQCRLLDRFAGCFKPGDTQFAAFQLMVLAPLYLQCLSGGDASTYTTASAAHVTRLCFDEFSHGRGRCIARGSNLESGKYKVGA